MSSEAEDQTATIRRLEKSVTNLKRTTLALGGVMVLGVTAAFNQASPDILRAKGIIIEDAEGRARILIGAPTPIVPERLRTDPARYEEAFGEQLGSAARDVGRLRNNGVGILVLDENGQDRVAIGSPLPDPLNGRRIGDMTGLSFHAANGIERGGIGHMTNAETGLDRSGIGVDSVDGEGAILVADADGTNGLVVLDGQDQGLLFVGRAPGDGVVGDGQPRTRFGLFTRDQAGAGIFVGSGSNGVETTGH